MKTGVCFSAIEKNAAVGTLEYSLGAKWRQKKADLSVFLPLLLIGFVGLFFPLLPHECKTAAADPTSIHIQNSKKCRNGSRAHTIL